MFSYLLESCLRINNLGHPQRSPCNKNILILLQQNSFGRGPRRTHLKACSVVNRVFIDFLSIIPRKATTKRKKYISHWIKLAIRGQYSKVFFKVSDLCHPSQSKKISGANIIMLVLCRVWWVLWINYYRDPEEV